MVLLSLTDALFQSFKNKLKQLEYSSNNLDNNLMSMEYLIKNLGLDQVVMRLGLQTNYTKDNINENIISESRQAYSGLINLNYKIKYFVILLK